MAGRFALYHAPPPGPLAGRAAAWLGHDLATGEAVAHPDLPGLPLPVEAITERPRKYGFHATLRAPFRPAPGMTEGALRARSAALAAGLAPVRLEGLAVAALGPFLALRPLGGTAALDAFAAAVVAGSNDWRAPLTEAEIARRNPDRLTARQRVHLDRWGYPHVMDDFRFHMTLTGPLDEAPRAAVETVLQAHLAPAIPAPYVIGDLCLCAEGEDGRFRLVDRFALGGADAPFEG